MKETTNKPMRKCCGCGQSKPKNELIRIAGRSGRAVIDMEDKASGRGIYLCFNVKCVDMAIKKKAFGRGLHTELSQENVQALADSAKELCGRQ